MWAPRTRESDGCEGQMVVGHEVGNECGGSERPGLEVSDERWNEESKLEVEEGSG